MTLNNTCKIDGMFCCATVTDKQIARTDLGVI